MLLYIKCLCTKQKHIPCFCIHSLLISIYFTEFQTFFGSTQINLLSRIASTLYQFVCNKPLSCCHTIYFAGNSFLFFHLQFILFNSLAVYIFQMCTKQHQENSKAKFQCEHYLIISSTSIFSLSAFLFSIGSED